MPKAEQWTDPVTYHGEGPVWSPLWRHPLKLVDMLHGDVVSLRADGELADRHHVGEIAAMVRPDSDGGLIVAVQRGFAGYDQDGQLRWQTADIWSDEGIRFNDGDCDPDGRVYCGSMAYDETPGAGALWRLEPDGRATRLIGDVTVSNGLDWSPDGSMAYYVDTATGRIDRFDYTGGDLVNRRPWVTIDTESGAPDGLRVDAEGCVWVALWGGGAVHRYRPDGRLDEVIGLPTRNVTACAFGGEHGTTLFVTTSRHPDADAAVPAAGAVFRVETGVGGPPARVMRSR